MKERGEGEGEGSKEEEKGGKKARASRAAKSAWGAKLVSEEEGEEFER